MMVRNYRLTILLGLLLLLHLALAYLLQRPLLLPDVDLTDNQVQLPKENQAPVNKQFELREDNVSWKIFPREVVKNSSNIGDMMASIDVLIRGKDKEGMHWALRNFERQLSKASDEDKAKWRGSVGVKLRDWFETNNQADYREIEKYLVSDSVKFVGNQKEYDRMIDMLRNAEDDVIKKVSDFYYFKKNVFPKMDLNLLKPLSNKTQEETKRTFTISARHVDYSKISVKPIDRIYLQMKNPRIRTEIKFNDLTYFFQFIIDVHMKKQGDKMVIDTFSLVKR